MFKDWRKIIYIYVFLYITTSAELKYYHETNIYKNFRKESQKLTKASQWGVPTISEASFYELLKSLPP